MGLISTYPNATTPLNSGDTFIASDAGDMNATKTVLIQDIADFITSNAFFVPYTGAVANLDLNTYTLKASSIIKTGGTSSQFLKADGSVDSNTYLTLGTAAGALVPYTGATTNVDLNAKQLKNIANPTAAQDASSKNYTDTQDALRVPYTGATANVDLGARSLATSLGLTLTGASAPLSSNGSVGTSGQILRSNGAGLSPTWVNPLTVVNFSYGAFYDLTPQTAAAINTAYPMKFGSNDIDTNGVTIGTASGAKTLITFANAGVYNIQFSAQFYRTSGGSDAEIDIWLKNFTTGTNVPATNTSLNIKANANYIVAAWNFFFRALANDQVQLMWATTDTSVSMVYIDATALHPSTPSVILTVNQIA